MRRLETPRATYGQRTRMGLESLEPGRILVWLTGTAVGVGINCGGRHRLAVRACPWLPVAGGLLWWRTHTGRLTAFWIRRRLGFSGMRRWGGGVRCLFHNPQRRSKNDTHERSVLRLSCSFEHLIAYCLNTAMPTPEEQSTKGSGIRISNVVAAKFRDHLQVDRAANRPSVHLAPAVRASRDDEDGQSFPEPGELAVAADPSDVSRPG